MKLKKIASLALAGIMAVSMLAGCKSNPADPETPTDPTTPASGVSTTFASYLTDDNVATFADDSIMQSALASAVKKVDNSAIKKADNSGNVVAIDSWAQEPVASLLKIANFNGGKNLGIVSATDVKAVTKKTTWFQLYQASGDYSENAVLANIANKLDEVMDSDILVENNGKSTAAEDYTTYEYTSSVSMQKVTTDDGKNSVWYVLVTVTAEPSKAL